MSRFAMRLYSIVYTLTTFSGPVPTEPAKPQAPAPADPVAERPRLPTPKDVDKSFFSKPQLRPPIKTVGGPPPRPPSNTKPALLEPQESSVSYITCNCPVHAYMYIASVCVCVCVCVCVGVCVGVCGCMGVWVCGCGCVCGWVCGWVYVCGWICGCGVG